MNCKIAGEMLSPFLDGELTREEHTMLVEHLGGCPYCNHELAELKRLTAVLRELGQKQIAVPSGFSGAVMERIKAETASTRVLTGKKHLKQAALSAAAVLLLAAGSTLLKPDPVNQIAKAPVQVETNYNDTGAIDPGRQFLAEQNSSPDAGMGSESKTTTDSSTTANEPAGENKASATGSTGIRRAEFTSDKDHVIISTLLRIKVPDSVSAESLARSLAASRGASMQSLGQQTQNGSLCRVSKIVLSNNGRAGMVNSLISLGTLISQQDEKADINERYAQLYDQLLSLRSRQAQSPDGSLDQQISEVERQLRSLDEQTSTSTIVLWLQQ